MITVDKTNSLKEDFEKETLDFWYTRAILLNNEEFNKVLAVKTRRETDLELATLNFEKILKKFIGR